MAGGGVAPTRQICILWLLWKLIKPLAPRLPSHGDRSLQFRKHQTALRGENSVCQSLHPEHCFLQQERFSWPFGIV